MFIFAFKFFNHVFFVRVALFAQHQKEEALRIRIDKCRQGRNWGRVTCCTRGVAPQRGPRELSSRMHWNGVQTLFTPYILNAKQSETSTCREKGLNVPSPAKSPNNFITGRFLTPFY